ncbi:MAG: hydroxymethylbilane synthase [Deltaproteobacteria bacterium]|nr:hydroxymethylbilane synthase [Deltaproteobacteria bacterium]
MMPVRINIGTRGSKLALWQANWVKSVLAEGDSSLEVNITIIKTRGDKILDVPLAKVGGKGLFVKEIEDALLSKKIDLAVHSMKDMPADLPAGLCIGAIPEREAPHDVLISRRNCTLSDLEKGATIGTSSLRRAAQLLHVRPDVSIFPFRGNLDTRLKKLDSGEMDAIVLAAAGIKRLGLAHRISEHLEDDVMLPAAGQGALCLEIREEDTRTGPIVAALNHRETRKAVLGERAFLHRMGGSCQVPIAAHGRIVGDQYFLTGLVAEIDGSNNIREALEGPADDAEKIGIALADRLMDMGAGRILAQLQQDSV